MFFSYTTISPNAVYLLEFFSRINFLYLLFSTFFCLTLFLFNNYSKKTILANFSFISKNVNYFLLLSILTLSFFFIINFFLYIKVLNNFLYSSIDNNFLFDKNFGAFFFFNLKLSIDLYGFILIFLAFFIGFFSLLASDNKIKNTNSNFFFYFHYFLLVVYALVSIEDVVSIFIFYELLLIPSFFFVYFISYTRKAMQASLYFVIWTQFGSILVLVAILYMLSITGSSSFSFIRTFTFKDHESYAIYTLFFFGFGFKVPIWPCHYWLTKTHVEAPSGFSIYLSGFLVKSALFAFFKLTNLISCEIETVLFSSIAFIGVIDASLKMWGQSDVKKLVAYCTIQEMNLILLMLLLGDSSASLCAIIFSAAHAFLSSLMFFLVDCVYRRFHSRSIYNINGLLHLTPNLGISIILMCVLYSGLPGTIKFSCEFFIFSTLFESSWISCLILMLTVNVFGLIGFSKPWFNMLFGLSNYTVSQKVLDLSWKEIYVIAYTFFFFFLINYIFIFSV